MNNLPPDYSFLADEKQILSRDDERENLIDYAITEIGLTEDEAEREVEGFLTQ